MKTIKLAALSIIAASSVFGIYYTLCLWAFSIYSKQTESVTVNEYKPIRIHQASRRRE